MRGDLNVSDSQAMKLQASFKARTNRYIDEYNKVVEKAEKAERLKNQQKEKTWWGRVKSFFARN